MWMASQMEKMSLKVKPKLPCDSLTLLCIIRSSSLRWQLTLSSCCILASDAVRALFTSMNSCTVIGPSERSDDSELCRWNANVRGKMGFSLFWKYSWKKFNPVWTETLETNENNVVSKPGLLAQVYSVHVKNTWNKLNMFKEPVAS